MHEYIRMLLKRGMGNGEWEMGNGKLKWEIENGKLNIFLHLLFITWNKFFQRQSSNPRFISEKFCAKIGEYNNGRSHRAFFFISLYLKLRKY